MKGRVLAEPVDVVVMWVDDQWPGYRAILADASGDPRDLNPNRTRDNLGMLRYGLRSVAQNIPNLRRIYLFTMRPQVPPWLDTSREDVCLVHHDEVIAPEHLPTFNSFSIVSHLHLLPGLSRRFLLVDDDMLVARPDALAAYQHSDGRPRAFFSPKTLPEQCALNRDTSSPWDLALAHTAEQLTAAHGARAWRRMIHGPVWIDRDAYADTMARFGPVIAETRAAPFRSAACVAPEILYPLDQWARGAAVEGPDLTPPIEGYASLENLWLWTWAQLRWLDLRQPRTVCLNDSFGAHPNARVEALVKAWLQRRFPTPSRFERAEIAAS